VERAKESSFRWVIVLIVFLAEVAVYMVVGSAPAFAASLFEAFKIGPAAIGIWMAAYFVGIIIFCPIAGILTDRFGTRIVVIIGLLISAISVILFGLVATYEMTIVLRVLIGIGTAFVWTAPPALLAKWLKLQEMGTGMAFYVGGVALGVAIVTFTAPILAATLTWRGGMFAVGVVALVVMALSGLLKAPKVSSSPSPTKSTPAPTEHDCGSTAESGSVYTNKWVWVAAIAFFGINAQMWGVLSYTPTYVATLLPPVEAGALASLVGLVGLPACFIAGVVSDKIKKRWPVMIWGAIFECMTILTVLVGPNYALLAIALILAGWGPICAATPLLSEVPTLPKLPAAKAGTALGLVSSVGFIGSIISVMYGGILVETAGWPTAYLMFTLGAVLALICCILLIKVEK